MKKLMMAGSLMSEKEQAAYWRGYKAAHRMAIVLLRKVSEDWESALDKNKK